MRFFILFVFLFCHSDGKSLNQKIVLRVSTDIQTAQKVLQETKQYFSTHSHIGTFVLQHKLALNLEKLDPYILITLSPIQSHKEKQTLSYILHKNFSDMFVVNNTFNATIPITLATIKKKEKVTLSHPHLQSDTSIETSSTLFQKFWKNLDNEWIGLLILALAGFLLIFRSARQISKIKDLQYEIEQYQEKIGNKMKNRGDTDG